MKEETKQTIRELYKDLNEVIKLNHPDVYAMPIEMYNSICKKLQYLERALKLSRKQEERLRNKLKELSK